MLVTYLELKSIKIRIYSIYRYFLENNIIMDYNEIFKLSSLLMLLILLVVLLGIITLNSKLKIILYSDINNSDISIKLNLKFMFDLININKEIYPLKEKNKKGKKKKKKRKKPEKNEKKNQEKGNNKNIKITLSEIVNIYKLVRKIEIHELYSKIQFGTEYIQITSSLYVIINSIYGMAANYLNPEKMYLGVYPDFTKNFIIGSFKIHIEPTIKELVMILIELLKIFIKNKRKAKGGKFNEGNRINTEFNGNNA